MALFFVIYMRMIIKRKLKPNKKDVRLAEASLAKNPLACDDISSPMPVGHVSAGKQKHPTAWIDPPPAAAGIR